MRLKKILSRFLLATLMVPTALVAVSAPAVVPAAAMAAQDTGPPRTPPPGRWDRSTDRPEPWRPSVQEEWTAPAGRYCSFPLHVRVVSQDVRVRVLARYATGAVRREEYAGPLTVDFVDVDTGRAVRRDAGGSGLLEYRPDGRWLRYTIVGPAGFGFRPGDHHPRGYYILDGLHVISIDPTGSRRLTLGIGRQDDICVALGDPAAGPR
ncbi:hypothetical protein GCM10027280_47970 [Micromonospora polyrhachis]|uniref:Uncharacterized protein n=1 Tax=Micromonospora polyrhachis TaxID=1282883 RepID=A0A7W7WR93_9ACTN|nr:hypothetical protein [Micromonospora polyrhachis]MBB4960649.1 hypothetical protein [Micromonospora polyrhachis]